MAIDQTAKRKAVIEQYVRLAGEVDDLTDRIMRVYGEYVQAGTFTDTDFQVNEHIDLNDLATLVTRLNALTDVITSPFARDILRKARK